MLDSEYLSKQLINWLNSPPTLRELDKKVGQFEILKDMAKKNTPKNVIFTIN